MPGCALLPGVSEPEPDEDRDPPDRPGTGGLVAALEIRRNAALGAVAGTGIAALLYAVRLFELLGPAPAGEGEGGPVLFAMLGVVLAFGVAVLVAAGLTLASAYRQVREL